MKHLVRASGGVLWREVSGGREILIAHRPRYDDWSLPKGKREAGESDEACALREVEEETGFRCTLGPELDGADYVDGEGRPKTVRYWAMQPQGGEFAANDEVDEIRWLSPSAARELLSYEMDRQVVGSFVRECAANQERATGDP